MKKDLLKTISHYGVNAQQRQLAEEVFELQEAITTHELKMSNYFDYWLPIFKRMYFKFKLLGDIKAIIELEDEVWKNWNLSKDDKKKIRKQIRGEVIE